MISRRKGEKLLSYELALDVPRCGTDLRDKERNEITFTILSVVHVN